MNAGDIAFSKVDWDILCNLAGLRDIDSDLEAAVSGILCQGMRKGKSAMRRKIGPILEFWMGDPGALGQTARC